MFDQRVRICGLSVGEMYEILINGDFRDIGILAQNIIIKTEEDTYSRVKLV